MNNLYSIKQLLLSFLASGFLFLLLSAALANAQEGTTGQPVPPSEPCRTDPLENWTSQEKWVWSRVCTGQIADFNEGWSSNRILRPEFLEMILLRDPYHSALTNQGVYIRGAWFKETLDLSNAILVHRLFLENSRFESGVDFSNLNSSQ